MAGETCINTKGFGMRGGQEWLTFDHYIESFFAENRSLQDETEPNQYSYKSKGGMLSAKRELKRVNGRLG